MNISIFGLGYVGIVTAGCLSSMGHNVIGVDVNRTKVDMMNEGLSPIVEKDLSGLLSEGKSKGLISATHNTHDAIINSELSIICVGTPSRANGSLNTEYLKNVCEEIGSCLKGKTAEHIIVVRSTMLPGTNKEIVIPILEKNSDKKEGRDFFVAFNPEFLREATAVYDFYNPPKTVVGCNNDVIAEKVLNLYNGLPGPMIKTSLEVAEMVKYADNNFHAVKVTFANEVGHVCKKLGIDSYDVMNIFMQDTKLNISTYYFRPGFAFGGSCLPKDIRAMNYITKMNDLETPLLNSLMASNNIQILYAIKKIMSYGKKKIGIAGFSFKAGTDDLRESPLVELIETLIGKGYELKLYDKNVSIAKLIGANKEYINHHIPHISSLMVDSLDELLKHSEVIVIGNGDQEFRKIPLEAKQDQYIYDLVRISDKHIKSDNYEGICW